MTMYINNFIDIYIDRICPKDTEIKRNMIKMPQIEFDVFTATTSYLLLLILCNHSSVDWVSILWLNIVQIDEDLNNQALVLYDLSTKKIKQQTRQFFNNPTNNFICNFNNSYWQHKNIIFSIQQCCT